MGFYTKTVLAIETKLIGKVATERLLLNTQLPSLMMADETARHESAGYSYFIFEECKWYQGYSLIDEVTDFLATLPDEETMSEETGIWGMIQTHEDDTNTIEGNPWDCGLTLNISIGVPEG